MTIHQLPQRPPPTADLEPAMRACERYIRRVGATDDGPGQCLTLEQSRAPEWRALVARLDRAWPMVPMFGDAPAVAVQLSLFDTGAAP